MYSKAVQFGMMEGLDPGILAGPVHPFDLTAGPRMEKVCQFALDAVRFIFPKSSQNST